MEWPDPNGVFLSSSDIDLVIPYPEHPMAATRRRETVEMRVSIAHPASAYLARLYVTI